MFFDLIFLLILIFVFEQFISYVTAMTGAIFSSDETNPAKGMDDKAEGLPSLQNVTNIVATTGARMANKSADTLRYTSNKASEYTGKTVDKIKKWNESRNQNKSKE